MGRRRRIALGLLVVSLSGGLRATVVSAQQANNSSVVQHIDAAVQARFENTLGYTVTENYAVFRNNDLIHPTAQMTVKTTYRKETGKSYQIVSQSGSEMIRRLVLSVILDNEQRINLPGNREGSWITSANYEMKLTPGGTQRLDGRDCYVVDLSPKRKAPQLIEGTLWVDARDYTVVQIQGTASKSPSVFTGPTQMMRQYRNVSGYAMATHARAISNSFLFGQTTVTIDYRDYQVQLRPGG
jgi:outer membrane lipoprotein-sorting protein